MLFRSVASANLTITTRPITLTADDKTITYGDALVGRLIAALDASPAAANTIVVLWSDHGWHLGEKQHWRKFTLWEEATKAPFMWVVPGLTKPGTICERTVDFMSIFPTLTDLCGIPTPAHNEGVSIRALLADPQAMRAVMPGRTSASCAAGNVPAISRRVGSMTRKTGSAAEAAAPRGRPATAG